MRLCKAHFGFCAAISALLLMIGACATSPARREYAEILSLRADSGRGAVVFEGCAGCHGPTGGGTIDGGVPRIAGQHFQVIVKQLVDYRNDRRWDPRMERFVGRHELTGQQIADVALAVSSMDRMSPRGVGFGTYAGRGVNVYLEKCRDCHGEGGQGNGRELIPRIAGQHYEYLLRQLHDAAEGRRPNFSRAHVRLLSRLEKNDLVGLADALSRADWPGSTGADGAR